MTIAIQQPYFFPYAGYFQLINEVDHFVFFDDVNFIKRGYINRNSLPSRNGDYGFTVPLAKASQNQSICDTKIKWSLFQDWKSNFLQTIRQEFSESPYFTNVFDLIEQTLNSVHENTGIHELASNSVKAVCNYLEIDCQFHQSCQLDYNRSNGAIEKICSISRIFQANHYINLPGGRKLYKPSDFDGLQLEFIDPVSLVYQHQGETVEGQSILGAMMYLDPQQIKSTINEAGNRVG
jgi:hypothetical protein